MLTYGSWYYQQDEKAWTGVSDAALERIYSHYTWSIYAKRLMTLSRVCMVLCHL